MMCYLPERAYTYIVAFNNEDSETMEDLFEDVTRVVLAQEPDRESPAGVLKKQPP